MSPIALYTGIKITTSNNAFDVSDDGGVSWSNLTITEQNYDSVLDVYAAMTAAITADGLAGGMLLTLARDTTTGEARSQFETSAPGGAFDGRLEFPALTGIGTTLGFSTTGPYTVTDAVNDQTIQSEGIPRNTLILDGFSAHYYAATRGKNVGEAAIGGRALFATLGSQRAQQWAADNLTLEEWAIFAGMVGDICDNVLPTTITDKWAIKYDRNWSYVQSLSAAFDATLPRFMLMDPRAPFARTYGAPQPQLGAFAINVFCVDKDV